MFGKPPSENQEVIYHKDSKTCDKMMGDQEFQGQYINLYSFLKSCYPLSMVRIARAVFPGRPYHPAR